METPLSWANHMEFSDRLPRLTLDVCHENYDLDIGLDMYDLLDNEQEELSLDHYTWRHILTLAMPLRS